MNHIEQLVQFGFKRADIDLLTPVLSECEYQLYIQIADWCAEANVPISSIYFDGVAFDEKVCGWYGFFYYSDQSLTFACGPCKIDDKRKELFKILGLRYLNVSITRKIYQ